MDGYHSVLNFAPVESYVMFRPDNYKLKSVIDSAMGEIIVDDPTFQEELYNKYIDTSTEDCRITRPPNLNTLRSIPYSRLP